MKYKLIIFGKQIFQELELNEDREDYIRIGTTKACSVRFNRTYFFSDFEMDVHYDYNEWNLSSISGVYFRTEDTLMRRSMVALKEGGQVQVYYEGTESLLCSAELMPDYDREICSYDHYVNISGMERLEIGTDSHCQIHLMDPSMAGICVLLEKSSKGYFLYMPGNGIVICRNGVKVTAARERICDKDFFSIDKFHFFLWKERIYYAGKERINVQMPFTAVHDENGVMHYPKFVRNARQRYAMNETNIEVLGPKMEQEKPKRNIWITVIPMMVSLILMLALRGNIGGGVFAIYSAAVMAVGGATSVWSYLNDGKEYKEKEQHRQEIYLQYIAEQEYKIAELRKKEAAVLSENYLSVAQDVKLVKKFHYRLFERQKPDNDYLQVYLGIGTVKSGYPVQYKKQEYKDTNDELADYPEQIARKYECFSAAPIVVDLKEINALGIIGSRKQLYEFLKNLVIDLAVRHFYEDVKFCLMFGEQEKKLFSWMRWLKNFREKENTFRNFMYDETSGKHLLDFLYSELSYRENLTPEECASLKHYVIFVYRSEIMETHPLVRYIEHAADKGFTFLFFEEHRELLEKDCDKIIVLDQSSNRGCMTDCRNSGEKQYFMYEFLSDQEAAACTRKLGSVYVESVSLEGRLVKNISLYEMLGIIREGDLDLKKNWDTSKVYENMAVPIGVKSGNELVYLDLHERSHGPHGLVAGTTGSGKSEILQTYVLSAAVLFSPYEVSFVIIDFKGGGMANQFKQLPHLRGTITNIDGRETERSLQSIRAELEKRQRLFAECGVNHIDAYIQKWKKTGLGEALPHLILIVDEFAELKSNHPDFMKELISTARIGRSLGVHLILATQKPSGVVDNQIWSNSRFRICLKVQGKEDSVEVLRSPLAAEIREPGRAYLQVGNNELFQLFQSAYSGASVLSGSTGQRRSFSVSVVELSGIRHTIYEEKIKKGEEEKTQLEALVQYIKDFCGDNGMKALSDICLPPLQRIIPYPMKDAEKRLSERGICVPIGILDDPSHQRQEEFTINCTEHNLFILGSARVGKTNLLQVILKGIGLSYFPDEVQIYILDFASMALKSFETMCHVGGVVTVKEDEKLKTLFRLLSAEIKNRQELIFEAGVSSFQSYLTAGFRQMPQILLIIDNFTALREIFPQYDETVLTICRDGLSAGISVVAANAQTSGIGYKYFSNFSKRISLYCHDSSEYSYLFEGCRIRPIPNAGRGLVEFEKTIYEFQTYQAFSGEREEDRFKEIAEYCKKVNKNNGNRQCRNIPEIPRVLTEDHIRQQFGAETGSGAYEILIGLSFSDITPCRLPILRQGVLGIMGRDDLGRSNFVCYLLDSVLERREQELCELYLFDGIERRLEKYKNAPGVCEYTLDAGKVKQTIAEVARRLEIRYQDMEEGNMEQLDREPLLVLVIQNEDCASQISSDRTSLELYKRIIGRYRSLKVLILITDLENISIGFGAPEVLRMLKENRNMLIFEDLDEQKFYDVPLSVAKEYAKPLSRDEAYRIQGNRLYKVKTVRH